MHIIILHLILTLSIFLISLAVFFYFYNKYRSSTVKVKKQIEIYENEYKDLDNRLTYEIKRQSLIISDYQNKILTLSNQIPLNQISVGQTNAINNELTIADLNADMEKLELEKNHFQEKNKKLWEQSIAVHKEMERIDGIRNEIESEHKQVIDSIFYAKRIQTALLPQTQNINKIFKEYFIYFNPRDIVSGDFYWVKSIGSKNIVVVADCTGHGVPGAFMSALGISFLNEIILHQHALSASFILEEMRRLVKLSLNQTGEADEAKDGMDMSVCVFDLADFKLEFAGANQSLFLYRDSDIIEYKGDRNPVGIYLKEKNFETQNVEVLKNDVFYMFSDGFVDEFGGIDGRKFKKQNLRKLILKLNNESIPLATQNVEFDKTMKNWLGDKYKQIDDILVFGFKIY